MAADITIFSDGFDPDVPAAEPAGDVSTQRRNRKHSTVNTVLILQLTTYNFVLVGFTCYRM